MEFDDGRDGAITVRNGERRRVRDRAGLAGRAPPRPTSPTTRRASLPAERPPASPESLAKGTVLGSMDAGFHADKAGEYLDPIADDLPLWRDERIAHPGYLVTFANFILSSNVKLGPWIHVETTADHFGAVADGERWSMRGRVEDAYERKGHKFVVLDLLVVANESDR